MDPTFEAVARPLRDPSGLLMQGRRARARQSLACRTSLALRPPSVRSTPGLRTCRAATAPAVQKMRSWMSLCRAALLARTLDFYAATLTFARPSSFTSCLVHLAMAFFARSVRLRRCRAK